MKPALKQMQSFMQRYLAKNHRKARRHGHAPAIVDGRPRQHQRRHKPN